MIPRLPPPFWPGCRQLTAIISKATTLAGKRRSLLKAAKEKKAATCGMTCTSCAFSCTYTLDGPASCIGPISLVTIRRHYFHCMRIFDAYGATYGCQGAGLRRQMLESQSGNTKLRAGVGQGGWSRLFEREKGSACIIPNLFAITHDHSGFRFRQFCFPIFRSIEEKN